MKRHSSVDFIKFFMAIVIVIYHYGIIFWGGYLVVECFFMISGFLMMNSVYRAKARGDNRTNGETITQIRAIKLFKGENRISVKYPDTLLSISKIELYK